jgi:hypothetical protein
LCSCSPFISIFCFHAAQPRSVWFGHARVDGVLAVVDKGTAMIGTPVDPEGHEQVHISSTLDVLSIIPR